MASSKSTAETAAGLYESTVHHFSGKKIAEIQEQIDGFKAPNGVLGQATATADRLDRQARNTAVEDVTIDGAPLRAALLAQAAEKRQEAAAWQDNLVGPLEVELQKIKDETGADEHDEKVQEARDARAAEAKERAQKEKADAAEAAEEERKKQVELDAIYRAQGISKEDLQEMHAKCTADCLDKVSVHGSDREAALHAGVTRCTTQCTKEMEEAGEALLQPTPEYKEQCYLLSNLFKLVDDKIKREKEYEGEWDDPRSKKLPYADGTSNASLLIGGSPYRFMNLLTQYPSHRYLHALKPHQISQLQPRIRLFKISTLNGASAGFQEVRFDPNLTPGMTNMTPFDDLRLLKDSRVRGVGVGIKDFTFAYEADNPFALKKSISAKLTLFANSFDELLRDRSMSTEESWSYADLALKTASPLIRNHVEAQNVGGDLVYDLDRLSFRLKAVVGWANPNFANTTFGGTSDEDKNLRDAIYNSFISLNLTPTIHEFDIDDLGRVTFTINYLAYVEEFFDQSNFNIFADVETTRTLLKRKLEYQTAVQDCNTADQLSDLKKRWTAKINEEKKKALQTLLKKMNASDEASQGAEEHEKASKIYFLNIAYDNVATFMKEGPWSNMPELEPQTKPSDSVMSSLMGSIDRALTPPDDTGKRIPAVSEGTVTYFYISDLVDVILKSIGDNLQKNSEATFAGASTSVDLASAEQVRLLRSLDAFRKLRVILGPVEITNPIDPAKSKYISLGDLPISVKYFIQWLTKKMLKREEVTYTLSNFLNAFLNELVREFIGTDDCFSGLVRQDSVRLSQAAITSYKANANGADEVTAACGRDGRMSTYEITSPPLLNIAYQENKPDGGAPDYGGLSQETNYLAYYAGRIMPAEQATGDLETDVGQGIYHYGIGRQAGIVKTINFKKTDSPGLKELRFEQQGYDGLQQLREQYDVEIKTYSNISAFPGVYIYVEPETIAPNYDGDLTQLGVGGYHMIIRSEHSFGPGLAESTITAKWVAERYTSTNRSGEKVKINPKKCSGRGTG